MLSLKLSVSEMRTLRLAKEAEERTVEVQKNIEVFEAAEKVRLAEADAIVEIVSVEMENRILEEDLEKAIETALANPVDFEFAIDKEGHIFRGRTTLSNKVEEEKLEKIPLPEIE